MVKTYEKVDMIEQGVHKYSAAKNWVKPKDPLLLERLEWFKDQKLALMIHWGPNAQLGIGMSWPLSDDDKEWSRETVDWTDDDEEFKRQYIDLNKTFNPIRFQPDVWADLAAKNGFKYLIFTTKHHDGFCLWDTKTTDYRITAKDCPFHTHKYADITKNVFNAFREKGLGIAAYFSKPDWHSPYYWAPGMKRGSFTNRNPSYDPHEFPWLWEKFTEFTHEQMLELISHYGPIDILWLDGGQVNGGKQNIKVEEVVEKARKIKADLIVADRTIGGEFENYLTPEQTIPEYALDVPWESCITIGKTFCYRYDDYYKSLQEIIHILIEVVAKGGNLALNVSPQPDGRLPLEAIERMKELGKWLDRYGEAIYKTRICAPYFTGKFAFTKREDAVYCFRLYQADEHREKYLTIPFKEEVQQIDIVGEEENIPFDTSDDGLTIRILNNKQSNESPIVDVFKLTT
ncbi:alpha-L-fucosidase [Bacillus sp. J14TS2]|uniref:alpha-L-fucosidase n=1 Tax=Bacillus sp. J14TS2 TaxID=2807188 RepID=UPI001B1C9E59|nr:alpha-L-fucosidase [Bacillus sp. J14TS2]GIN72510.1 alpha-L-fucosidase [Bacillus sp. J14TS2]